MTGWVLFGITLLLGVGLGAALHRRGLADVARTREESQAEVAQAKAQARSRVDRLEREADRTRHELRDALLRDIFPAVDALVIARDGTADPELRRGLELAVGEFERGLARHGVESIAPAAGAVFDPDRHEAVETLESDELDAGSVGRCHRIGWATEGRVLRPAMVGVVRAASPALPDGPDGAPDEAPVAEVVGAVSMD